MTIFLSNSIPRQPAFLYAAYGASAAIVASSSRAGTNAASLLQPDEAQGWAPSATDEATLTLDLGSSMLISYLALAGNLAGSIAGSGPVLSVDWSADGSTFTPWYDYFTPPPGISAWLQLPPQVCRYLRITVDWFSSAFLLRHVCVGNLVLLPFFDDDCCTAPAQAEGTNLVGYTGLYLGSVTQRVMMPFSLSFGQISPAEETAFAAWFAACVATAQGFFLVPDTAQPACHFGSVDRSWKYEPKMKTGLYTIPAIPFTARAI